MTDYAEIAINRDLQTFTYKIPNTLLIDIGHMVRVPFRTANEAGIVVRITHEKPDFATKPILEVLDPKPVLSPVQIELAHWIAEYTLSSLGRCLWLMLPPGFTPKSDYQYSLNNPDAAGKNTIQNQLISLLQRRGTLSQRQIKAAMSGANWQSSIKTLVKNGSVAQTATLSAPPVKPKMVRNAQLAISAEDLEHVSLKVGRESKRANVLEILWQHGELPLDDVAEVADCTLATIKKIKGVVIDHDGFVQLDLSAEQIRSAIIKARGGQPYIDILQALLWSGGMLDVGDVYQQTGTTIRHLKRLHEDGYIVLGESEVWRKTLADKHMMPDMPPDLTPTQTHVWGAIETALNARATGQHVPSHAFLIHGVTGSGKTEIYLRAVDNILEQGRQALIMVPEIALTTQTVKRFARRFPDQVALIHSTLSMGERFDTWRRIRDGKIKVVIGARSALFAPLPDVGLIILDEEHDPSYKQAPPVMPPYYHARDVALEYMRRQNGTVLLGSATPDVESYYRAQQGDYTLLEMPERVTINGNVPAMPPVQIVDMRHELRMGNISIFSRVLQQSLHEVLNKQQQAILFLNRRGMATYVFCRDCGFIAKCDACDSTLTYHEKSGQYQNQLVCHSCGHTQQNPRVCPNCHSHRIKYFGRGTEQITKVLETEFPHARVLRWDRDSASGKGQHETIYEAFANQEADILVGTQMIAKGLDIPNVTLVGIISGDTALGLPHYRANETTFQLLTQVAGRAGRGDIAGKVILQTYQPEHYAIQAAAAHDYHAFFGRDIKFRQKEKWTPFKKVARILFRDRLESQVIQDARGLLSVLSQHVRQTGFTDVRLLGPAPCFFHKRNDIYHWQIVVKADYPAEFLREIPLPPTATIDIHPLSLL